MPISICRPGQSISHPGGLPGRPPPAHRVLPAPRRRVAVVPWRNFCGCQKMEVFPSFLLAIPPDWNIAGTIPSKRAWTRQSLESAPRSDLAEDQPKVSLLELFPTVDVMVTGEISNRALGHSLPLDRFRCGSGELIGDDVLRVGGQGGRACGKVIIVTVLYRLSPQVRAFQHKHSSCWRCYKARIFTSHFNKTNNLSPFRAPSHNAIRRFAP